LEKEIPREKREEARRQADKLERQQEREQGRLARKQERQKDLVKVT
jgi:hypothetical protein